MTNSDLLIAYDWAGPEGTYPNALSLEMVHNQQAFEKSNYAVSNRRLKYDLESRRHPFTMSKLDGLFYGICNLRYEPISEIGSRRYIYDITPLLKPHQWLDDCFRYVSLAAKTDNQNDKNIILINDMNEGYGNSQYSFFDKLYYELERNNLKAENVWYVTMNSILEELHREYCSQNNIRHKIKIFAVYIYEQQYVDNSLNRTPTKHFISLNRSPNPHRHAFVYALWCRGLIPYGQVSFPSKDTISDYQINKKDLDMYGLDGSKWDQFLDELPFIVDSGNNFTEQDCTNIPIHDFYKDSVFSVVSEQIFDDHENVKFTEKLFHPINNNCLPVFLSSPDCVKHMTEKMGYKTMFYDYDNISDGIRRFNAVVDTIEHICSYDISALNIMVKNTREHNRSMFNTRVKQNTITASRRDLVKELSEWLKS